VSSSSASVLHTRNKDQRDPKGTTEMEFLEINLTKNLSLLVDAISSTGGFYRKPHSTLVLKIHTKKSAKQENLSLIMNNSRCRTEKRG
jgi:hypothetical protein